MGQPLLSLLALILMNLAAYALGHLVASRVSVLRADRFARHLWTLAIGWILAGTGLGVLGLVGYLDRSTIGLATLLLAFAGITRACRARPCAAADLPDVAAPAADMIPPLAIHFLLALAGLACLGSLIGALAPPLAGDALCYHLELPKVYLREHHLVHLAYHDNSTFPLLAEMWYLWALALESEVAAQLVHWQMGLLLAGGSVLLATPLVGRSAAWLVGAAVILVPGVNNQMTAPLNDVALAAMATFALAAWWQFVARRRAIEWLVLAGLALGGAMAVKYTGLVFAAALGLVWCLAACTRLRPERSPDERSYRFSAAVALLAIVAISVAGLWYARAAWYRGNPVFPFFAATAGGSDPATELPAALPASKTPLGRNPIQWLLSPWHVFMTPERFGGRSHQLGIWLLACFPGLIFARRLRGLGVLLAVAGVYWTLWFLLRQNVRFLYPALPPLTIAAVWVCLEAQRFPWRLRTTVSSLLGGLLVAAALLPLARAYPCLAVAVGLQSRSTYLLCHEPTYSAALVSRLLLPEDAHILSQEQRAFYIPRRLTRESIYRRYTHYDRQLTDPASLSAHLRQQGFSHLLLAETAPGTGTSYDATLSRLAERQARTDPSALMPLAEYEFHEEAGPSRRYRLLLLR